MFRDFKPIVVEECTGTTLPHLHEPALEMIRVGWGEVRRSRRRSPTSAAAAASREARRALPPGALSARLRRLRRCAAERAGYERAWLVDCQMLWQDLYVYMTHALAATERIVVGSGVTNPLTRHPSVTASAHRDARRPAPGPRRARHRPRRQRGADARAEAGADGRAGRDGAAPARAGWRASEAAGTAYPLGWTSASRSCSARRGRRTCALAGALADIVMIYVGVHPASVRWAIDHVRAGAEEAGRDPDDVEIAALCAMHVATTRRRRGRSAAGRRRRVRTTSPTR